MEVRRDWWEEQWKVVDCDETRSVGVEVNRAVRHSASFLKDYNNALLPKVTLSNGMQGR